MSSHYDVQLHVDQELLTDNAVVTISGNHAVAYLPVEGGGHKQALRLFITRKDGWEDDSKVILFGYDPDHVEHHWAVSAHKRRPCNCGKRRNGGAS